MIQISYAFALQSGYTPSLFPYISLRLRVVHEYFTKRGENLDCIMMPTYLSPLGK